MSTDLDQAAFYQRCMTDMGFAKNALAAVLSNDETMEAFEQEMWRQAGAEYGRVRQNFNMPRTSSQGTTTFSYHRGKSVQEQLAVLPPPSHIGPDPMMEMPGMGGTAQLTLVGAHVDWVGMLPLAAKLMVALPFNALVMAVVQALFGTKLGMFLLPALLVL